MHMQDRGKHEGDNGLLLPGVRHVDALAVQHIVRQLLQVGLLDLRHTPSLTLLSFGRRLNPNSLDGGPSRHPSNPQMARVHVHAGMYMRACSSVLADQTLAAPEVNEVHNRKNTVWALAEENQDVGFESVGTIIGHKRNLLVKRNARKCLTDIV